MKPETPTAWSKFDGAAFDEGVVDGKEESHFADFPLETHESMGDEYCTGFSFGVIAAQAFDAGFKAGDHLRVCCCHLAEGQDPDLAYEWMKRLWTAFRDSTGRGFSA